jgi:hypothetical protein
MNPWRRKPADLETELRANRPEPSDDLLHRITGRMNATEAPRRLRLGFAAALTVAILGALSAVGGMGYAASATSHAVTAVKNVVVKAKTPETHLNTVQQSPAQSQYKPGCGLGDENHTHTGPPGQGGVCPAKSPKNQP